MNKCPHCGEEYSYGRCICHICEDNSLPFGKIFDQQGNIHKWNCGTSLACTELLESDLDSIKSFCNEVPNATTKIEVTAHNVHKWNCEPLKDLTIPIRMRKNQKFHLSMSNV